MNICKVLDLSPGTAMSSWGTIHFPDGRRIIEFVINVKSTDWHSTSWSPCKLAPEGGFEAIQEGQTALMEELATIDPNFRAHMICREDIPQISAIRLLMDEMGRINYPLNLNEEAAKIEKILTICAMPPLSKKPPSRRRFEVD